MNLQESATLEIEIEIEVTHYQKAVPETRIDPGCSEEVEFIVYMYNEKRELVLIQDEIVLRYAEELYDLALGVVHNKHESQRMEQAEYRYEVAKEEVLRRR